MDHPHLGLLLLASIKEKFALCWLHTHRGQGLIRRVGRSAHDDHCSCSAFGALISTTDSDFKLATCFQPEKVTAMMMVMVMVIVVIFIVVVAVVVIMVVIVIVIVVPTTQVRSRS